jgi:hypothetical protein
MLPGVDVGPAEARACLRHVGTERFDHADFDIKLSPDDARFGVWRRVVSTEHNQMRATMQARLLAGHRLGRMPGATPLREAEMRWEVAVFGMLTRKGGRLRGRPVQAAEFAASVFKKSVAMPSYSEGEAVELSFTDAAGRGAMVTKTIARSGIRIEHDPEERDDARKFRRDKILREAPELIAGATGADLAWLEIAMQALDGLFNAMALDDDEALRRAVAVLESPVIGWLARLKNPFLK